MPRKSCHRESVRDVLQRSPSRSVRGRERAKRCSQGMPRCGRDAALPPPHPFRHTGRDEFQTRPLISVLYACFPSITKPHLETQPSRLRNFSQPNPQTKQPKMPLSNDSQPQLTLRNSSLNSEPVWQVLTLARTSPKYDEVRLRGREFAGPRYSSACVCLTCGIINRFHNGMDRVP